MVYPSRFFKFWLIDVAAFAAVIVWGASSYSASETVMAYFGGGGERSSSTNTMDESLEDARDLARERRWQSYFQADVEHPSTKRMIGKLSDGARASIEDFTAENFESRMNFLTKQIEDGKITSSQQLLVIVDTHGGRRDANGENDIAVSKGNSTNLTGPVMKLVAAATAKGVKLGLVLANCYSGDLRRDIGQAPGVCVVSGSTPKRLATADFSDIISQMKKSPNLEDAYLKTRKGMWISSTQPGINTTAGEKAEDDLLAFRNYHFHTSGAEDAQADRICTNTSLQMEKLLNVAKRVQDQSQIRWYQFWRNTNSEAGRKLIEGLKMKERSMDAALAPPETGPWGITYFDCVEKQPAEMRSKCEQIHRNHGQTLVRIRDQIALLKDDPSSMKRPRFRPMIFLDNGSVDQYLKALRERERAVEAELQNAESIAIRREVARYKVKDARWRNEQESLYLNSFDSDLNGHERQLYDSFYDHYAKENPASNACREFRLK